MKRVRRGLTLIHAFAIVFVLSALVAGIYATQRSAQRRMAPDGERAQARAIAQAAWARARADLRAGRSPQRARSPLLGGEAQVDARVGAPRAGQAGPGRTTLTIRAWVDSPHLGGRAPSPLEVRWRLVVTGRGDALRVLSREETPE